MTKRKADDLCMSPQPNAFRPKYHHHNVVPTWSSGIGNEMMTSPPPMRRQSLFDESSLIPNEHGDMEMDSPIHGSPMQRSLSAQKFWRAMCSPNTTSTTTKKRASLEGFVPEPSHPLCQPKLVPKEQLDAVLSEVSSLKQTIAWLTRELNESRSKIAHLEAQNQTPANQICSSTPLAATSFQQPVYFAPHQFMPVLQDGA